MNYILHFLNPFKWLKAYQFQRENANYDKSSYDLELYLYSKILKNDMLHYGYFEDANVAPEKISLYDLEAAQIEYSEQIIRQIKNEQSTILDVGCGMGGFANLMLSKGLQVEVLTPNKNQINHIQTKYPSLKNYHTKFEKLETEKTYGTIINSESLQYINLEDAFQKVNALLDEGGQWIITDYFRLNENGINKSGHLLSDFRKRLEGKGWKIVYEQDITPNVLPTLDFVNMYVQRFLLPVKHFAFEKLRFKSPKIFYMTEVFQGKINAKLKKELASIDTEQFRNEKGYFLLVLERN